MRVIATSFATVGGLLVLGILVGSSGFQPSASAVSQYRDVPVSLANPSMNDQSPTGGVAMVEPRIYNRRAVLIRSYLGRRFLYRRWYRKVRTIMVKGRTGFVSTSLPGTGGGSREAREICAAVLSSDVVTRVRVGYGTRALACS